MAAPLPSLPNSLQILAQESSLPLLVILADGRIGLGNSAAGQIAKFTPGTALMTWAHPDHATRLLRALASPAHHFSVVAHLGTANQWRHCHVLGRRSLTDPAVWVLVCTDVTERYERGRYLDAFERLEQPQVALSEWVYHVDTQSWEPTPEAHALFFGPDTPYALSTSNEAFLAAIHPEDRAPMEEHQQDAIGHETAYHTEYRTVWPDGSIHWLGSFAVFLHDINDRPTLSGFLTDRTEPQMRGDAAREAERLESLAVLAGGVGHELNNKLAVILGALSLLEPTDPPSAAADPAELVRLAKQAAEAAGALARQLLHLSRNVPSQQEPIAPASLLEPIRAWARLHPQHQLVFEVAEPLWPLLGDRVALQQVVDNLVRNAFEVMPDGGRLRLLARNASSEDPLHPWVELAVADSGPGIPAAVRDRLFDPFYTTKSWGHGLGLATVHAIVRQHGGTIAVEMAPEGGALFRVRLPGHPETANPSQTPPPTSGWPLGGTVCIIDDVPEVLTMAATLVHSLGLTAQTASCGAAALEQLRAAPCDVILLDWVLGAPLTGQATYDRLRAAYPDLPIIITTGFADAPLPEGVPVLPKPYTRQQLAEALGPYLSDAGRTGLPFG